MKKGIFLLMMIGLFAFNAMAQKRIDPVDSSYVASSSDTLSITYGDSYNGSVYYDGIVGFQFTLVNYVDSFSHVYLMGSWDEGVNLVLVDSVDRIVDSTYLLYDAPPKYPQYFLYLNTATGDTATAKNITQFEKVSKK